MLYWVKDVGLEVEMMEEEEDQEPWSCLLSWRSTAEPGPPSPQSYGAWPAPRPPMATRGLLLDQDGLHCPMVQVRGLRDLRHCPTSDLGDYC